MFNFEVWAYLVKIKEGEDFNHRQKSPCAVSPPQGLFASVFTG